MQPRTQRFIRESLAVLLRLEPKADLPDGPPGEQAYPTEAKYFIEWTEPITSTWNAIAVMVAYEYIVKERPDLKNKHDPEVIRKKVRKHIGYLQWKWKRQRGMSEADTELYNRNRSCYTRKRSVSTTTP